MVAMNYIPLMYYVPGWYTEVDPSRAVRGVAVQPHESLLIGQILSGAGAAATPYQVDSAAEAVALFGAKSQLAQMAAAYKAVDTLTPLTCIGLADAGSPTAATGSIVWTGTATESRELVLYVSGRRIPVSVVTGDTAAAVETKALAALALVANDLPVTYAGDAAAGVDFTAVHGGAIGNQIAIGHSQLPGERPPAGLTVTVTAMSSGATDPSYSGAVTAMGDTQYHTVVHGLVAATPTGLLVTEMTNRWNGMAGNDGVLFGAYADTRANLTTLGNSFNSGLFVLPGMEVSPMMQLPWETAAKVAALSARRAQTLPSLALTGQQIPGAYGAKRGSRFTDDQRNTLLSDGVATMKVAQDGTLCVERLVTTYQVNAQSLPDTALQDLTSVRTLSAMRYSFRVRMAQRYGQSLLGSDGGRLPSGLPLVTPDLARAEVIALADQWIDLGWMEGASMPQFKSELLVQRSQVDPNRLDFLVPPDLMNNLLVGAAKFAFIR